MLEWMVQADPLRETSTVIKMNDRSLILSFNKIIDYFKKWTTAGGILKKYNVFTKI